MPTDLLTGYLALLRKLVDRGLRDLQVDDKIINREHCVGRDKVAAVHLRRNSSATRSLARGSHDGIEDPLAVAVNC